MLSLQVEHLHGGEGRYRGILRPLLIIAREEVSAFHTRRRVLSSLSLSLTRQRRVCVLRVIQGIRGYWKGNATNVVRIIPTSAARFYTFEIYKTFLRRFVRRDQLNTVRGGHHPPRATCHAPR